MGIGIAAGHPDYSSAGTSKFIPEIWSGKLLVKFYTATVFGEIANTDYEGEIKDQGDKIYIRTTPSITIKPYVKGQKLVYERPESPNILMEIDKGQYFAFVCDDVDKHQADIRLMDNWAKDASEQMKITIDADVLSTLHGQAGTYNYGATAGKKSGDIDLGTSGNPLQLTKADVIDFIVNCGTVLDEQDVPEGDRWMLLPAWAIGMIKKSDLRDASVSGDSGNSILRNGRIGRIDRFTLYSSNQLSTTTDGGATVTYAPFGHKSALSFASQMTQMDTLKAESTFGQLVRGLNVYGHKVLKTESLGYGYIKK